MRLYALSQQGISVWNLASVHFICSCLVRANTMNIFNFRFVDSLPRQAHIEWKWFFGDAIIFKIANLLAQTSTDGLAHSQLNSLAFFIHTSCAWCFVGVCGLACGWKFVCFPKASLCHLLGPTADWRELFMKYKLFFSSTSPLQIYVRIRNQM